MCTCRMCVHVLKYTCMNVCVYVCAQKITYLVFNSDVPETVYKQEQ